jgi:hypothetical protein
VIYDRDGTKYKSGKGVTVYLDGKKTALIQKQSKYEVVIGPPIATGYSKQSADFALNITRKDFPAPSASVNSVPDSLYQAIDGRIWYFPEISNRWSTFGSNSPTDWFALDFGEAHEASIVKIYLYADGKTFAVPDSLSIEYKNGDHWLPVRPKESNPAKLAGNTVNTVVFDKVSASGIRLNFRHETRDVAITEVECY